MTLTVGQSAPDFSLPDQHGEPHRLGDYRGRWVLLYFYPKDDTPGCTAEACGLRDNLPRFADINAAVLGISVDDVASHRQFAQKYDLPFTLLADEQKRAVAAYGVWGEKSFAGKTYLGTSRTSYLIDPEGRIAKIYEQVKPERHAAEVLADLAELRK